MPNQSRSTGPLWLQLILALGGALFCAAMPLGWSETVCATKGCSLTKEVALAGFSLWWWGAGGFGLLALLAFLGWAGVLYFTVLLALVADCLLLAWLALTAPCLSCMIAGLTFFVLFITMRGPRFGSRPLGLFVSVLWLIFFSPNLLDLGRESVGPWPVYGKPDAPVSIYFSPSCPACRRTINDALAGNTENMVFYPVAENDEDFLRIAVLANEIEQGSGLEKAFAACLAKEAPQPDMSGSDRLGLQFKLLRNRAALANMGADTIPVIVTQGRPTAQKTETPPAATPEITVTPLPIPGDEANPSETPDNTPNIFDADGYSGCSEDQPENCEESQP